ncbi:MAG: hypothetical protein DRQ40_00510 [Gammaproteobacteria bacterium]|nr:MAG: hypothetical protein DRQ40_00510 [Gammaproteobacteria bacterium]RLB68319.1 MAG: hypothetical protein DRH08_01305 [Deltaproteobacteria bacterium]
MSDNGLKEKLLSSIVDRNGNISSGRLKFLFKNEPDLYRALILKTSWNKTNNLMERVHCLVKDISEPVLCRCGKPVLYSVKKRSYGKVCELGCSQGAKDSNKKRQETCMKRYGVSHNSKIPEVVNKRQQTFLERYGTSTPLQNEEIRQKAVNTLQKNYGVSTPMASPEIKKKQQNTVERLYGVDNVSRLPSTKLKVRETVKERYGVDSVFKSPEIQERIKTTNLDNFGVENVFANEEVKLKIKRTNLEKYGSECFMQSHIPEIVTQVFNNDEVFAVWISILQEDLKISVSSIANYLGIAPRTLLSRMERLEIDRKRFSRSSLELEIVDWLTQLGVNNIVTNDRKIISPLEVDLLLPDHNLAIEMCGLFWHSFDKVETTPQRVYHQHKTLQLKEKGYSLVTIFEHEWNIKKSLVKNMILARLKNTEEIVKLFARKCQCAVVEDSKIIKTFLTDNHIQGYIPSKRCYGLYSGSMLVALMTFGKSRYSKTSDFEILRFCTRQGFRVTGGASKMFSAFKKDHKNSTVISYCDLRYGNGKVYEALGFQLQGISKPNYFYYNNRTRQPILYSRLKFQKHKLPDLLEDFDESLTEAENMFRNGYRRIWDCGSLVYTFVP